MAIVNTYVAKNELPALGTAGQVLTVNSGATGLEWASLSVREVPSSTSSDADKILYVNSSGAAAWGHKITFSTSDPSGGSDGDIWFQYEA